MICGPCAIDQHQKCTGLLRATFGFCRCADHDHAPAPTCPWCDRRDCPGDCPQFFEAIDDSIYDEEA